MNRVRPDQEAPVDSGILVGIASSNFWPERTSTGRTVGEFGYFLAQHGIEVRVATAMPFYPEWRIWPEFRGRIWSRELRDGMTVFRSWHMVSESPSTVKRLLHELTLCIFAVPNLLRAFWRARVAYVVSPALTYALTATVIAWLLGVRRVLIVKDVMPDAAIELGMLKSPLLIAVSRRVARLAYALSDEIHTLGVGMQQRIARESAPTRRVEVVPDTIDGAELEPVPYEHNEFRKLFVPPGVFAVLHTGNMGKKQDLDLLLRAAQRMVNDPTVQFYVFGDGAVRSSFVQKKAALGLKNVTHGPLQERWLLRHMLSGADVVLVSQVAEVVDIVVPSKLITSMGAGAMVVAACAPDSEAALIINASDGGLLIPAGDEEGLVREIRRIQCGEVDNAAFRRRAREYALKTFDREAVYGRVLRALQT